MDAPKDAAWDVQQDGKPDADARNDVSADADGVDGGSTMDAPGDGLLPDGDAGSTTDAPGDGLLPNGAACLSGNTCSSGRCVDGVCCAVACATPCYACDVKNHEGTCVPVPAGDDPKSDCAEEPKSTCGRDGTCDGAGACRKYSADTVCAAASCAAGRETSMAVCDGAGRCADAPSKSCGSYLCNLAGTACLSSCSGDADCNGTRCHDGSCGKLDEGSACGDASDCLSGFCEQKVCCRTTCTGGCRSCALPGLEGVCAKLDDGTVPPAGVCPTGAACLNGACACSGSTSLCGAMCVDLSTDPENCLTCGNICPTGASCTADGCKCPAGQSVCGAGPGKCMDLGQDTSNCGACEHKCAANEGCSAGNCVDFKWARWSVTPVPLSDTIYTTTADTVLDSSTGLMWQRRVEATVYSFADAAAHCDSLTLGGFGDWRIPSVIELESLVDQSRVGPATNATVFPSTPAGTYDRFWTSTSGQYVEFKEGLCGFASSSETNFVRCVRLGKVATGAHYTVGSSTSDGTVKDNYTGLTWQKGSWGSPAVGNPTARDYCAQLSLGDRSTGWRLPTVRELQTLVDFHGAGFLDTSVFSSLDGNWFWAADDFLGAHAYQYAWWAVSFTTGQSWPIDSNNSCTGCRVRCVHP